MEPETNSKFVDYLKNLENRLYAIESARQPYLGDWIELNLVQFSYSSASQINITGFDPRTRFAIGDRLRITQNSTVKYFVIYSVSSSSINIYGGTDYTFTSDAITAISFSKFPNPTGWPVNFTYTPIITPIGGVGGGSVSPSVNSQFKFSMFGNNIYLGVINTNDLIPNLLFSLSGYTTHGPSEIRISPPIPFTNNTSSTNVTPGLCQDFTGTFYDHINIWAANIYNSNVVVWCPELWAPSNNFHPSYFIDFSFDINYFI